MLTVNNDSKWNRGMQVPVPVPYLRFAPQSARPSTRHWASAPTSRQQGPNNFNFNVDGARQDLMARVSALTMILLCALGLDGIEPEQNNWDTGNLNLVKPFEQ